LAEFGSFGDALASASPVLDFSLVASAAGSAFVPPLVDSTIYFSIASVASVALGAGGASSEI
jgi:hypothetical protein